MLIDDRDIEIGALDGSPMRRLVLDPSRDYRPQLEQGEQGLRCLDTSVVIGVSRHHRVEVLGRYSNGYDHGKRLQALLKIAPDGTERAKLRTTKQEQRHLSGAEITQLVRAYKEGSGVRELAGHFGIHRSTVSSILNRRGVNRRPTVMELRIDEAKALYETGWSVARIGSHLRINPSTVARALGKAGVSIRPRPGWKY